MDSTSEGSHRVDAQLHCFLARGDLFGRVVEVLDIGKNGELFSRHATAKCWLGRADAARVEPDDIEALSDLFGEPTKSETLREIGAWSARSARVDHQYADPAIRVGCSQHVDRQVDGSGTWVVVVGRNGQPGAFELFTRRPLDGVDERWWSGRGRCGIR